MNEKTVTTVQHKRMTKGKFLKKAIFIALGALIMAVGLELFLIPNNVIDGGITGISIMLSYITGAKLGIFILVLNLPFFYLGYKHIGKTFAFSTMYGVIMLSLFTTLFHHTPKFTGDILLATVFGGIIIGVGIGIVMRSGGTLDGTETLAVLFSKNLPFSVGEIILFINIFILGCAGFVYSWDRAMYSLLAYFVASKTIDVVILGLDESKSAWIISDKHKDIGEALLARLGRGVTYLNGEGAYSGEDKKVILCIITRLEEAKLKSIVDEIDPNAFLAMGNVAEVRGGRFKKKAIH